MKITKKKSVRTTVAASVDQENYELVKAFTDRAGISFSWLFDTYLSTLALTIKTGKLLEKENISKLDLLKLALSGLGAKL